MVQVNITKDAKDLKPEKSHFKTLEWKGNKVCALVPDKSQAGSSKTPKL